MLRRFDTIPECDRRTDRQTDILHVMVLLVNKDDYSPRYACAALCIRIAR